MKTVSITRQLCSDIYKYSLVVINWYVVYIGRGICYDALEMCEVSMHLDFGYFLNKLGISLNITNGLLFLQSVVRGNHIVTNFF